MPNSFKKFKKVPLVMSMVVFTVSCLIFFYLYKQIQNNDKISGELELQWQDEANKRDEIKSLDVMLKAIESERVLLEDHFIQSSDVVPFLNLIEKLGPEAGAETEVLLVDIAKDNSGVLVGISATGRFEALYKFLTLLENSPFELEIASMDLQETPITSTPDNKNPAPQWTGVFKVKVLSFVQ